MKWYKVSRKLDIRLLDDISIIVHNIKITITSMIYHMSTRIVRSKVQAKCGECHGVSWCQVSMHFLVNDIFMCFFFGLAIKEVTEALPSRRAPKNFGRFLFGALPCEALLPGGSLSPIRRATNPLMATLGGVVGPVAAYAPSLDWRLLKEPVMEGDGVMEWVFGFLIDLRHASEVEASIDTFLTLRLSDYQYVIWEICISMSCWGDLRSDFLRGHIVQWHPLWGWRRRLEPEKR